MANLKEVWRARRQKQNDIERQYGPYLCVTANDGPGVVAEVSSEAAARLLLADTHRVSSADEIKRFREDGRKQAEAFIGRALQHSEIAQQISVVSKRPVK